MSSEEYPLYPALTEQGKEEAQRIMDSFKPRLVELMDEVLGKLYTEVSFYVESDHWDNYRNSLMNGFRGYGNGSTNHAHDFKELRQEIYRHNKEDIIKDLNQDLNDENNKLMEQVDYLNQKLREI